MATWHGPYNNPLLAAQFAAGEDAELLARLRFCVLNLFNWVAIEPDDGLLDDLLQEIAGDTNIVVQHRGNGWFAAIDD